MDSLISIHPSFFACLPDWYHAFEWQAGFAFLAVSVVGLQCARTGMILTLPGKKAAGETRRESSGAVQRYQGVNGSPTQSGPDGVFGWRGFVLQSDPEALEDCLTSRNLLEFARVENGRTRRDDGHQCVASTTEPTWDRIAYRELLILPAVLTALVVEFGVLLLLQWARHAMASRSMLRVDSVRL
jgi:hypothetical protein